MSESGLSQDVGVGGSVVRQGVELHMAPDRFDRVEFRRVSREILAVQPRMAPKEAFHRRGFVDVEIVPDEDDVSTEMAEEVPQEEDHPFGVDIQIGGQGKVKSDPVTPGRDRDDCDDRYLLPVASSLVEDWRLSARCPGSTDQRRQKQPAFVEENEVGVQPPGVFFIRGQSFLTHRRMASSSRSRARRSGFCGLQPRERRRRLR